MHYFTIGEILQLHYMLVEDFGGSHGVRDEARLASLVEAPQQIVFGEEQYPTAFLKAAVYMRNCMADHVFVDGNKRTGVSLAGIYLSRHGIYLTATEKELELFTISVITDHLEVDIIASWLEQNSKKVRK